MSPNKMRFLHNPAHLVLGMIWLSLAGANAQVATSRIVGYNATTCLGGSDTFLSIPFHQAPAYSGSVDGSLALNNAPISVPAVGTPGWTVNEFAGTHYVKFTSGSAAGLILEISANTASGFTVDPTGFGRLSISSGDRFLIVPHWTLASLLPPLTQTTLHPSTGDLLPQRGSEIHFYESSSTGVELAPERIYYVTSSGWFQSAVGSPTADNVIIPAHSAFVIRHQLGAADTSFRPAAHVDVNASSVLLSRQKGAPQDNVLAIIRPIPIRLGDLGFSRTSFVDSSTTAESTRKDEVIIFDNATAAHNKDEQARYFRYRSQWRLDNGVDYPVSDYVELPAGSVVIVRKSSATSDAPVAWKNDPNY